MAVPGSHSTAQILENDAVLLCRPDVPEEVRQDIAVVGGRKPELWVMVEVEEAYIHCSKHIPLLQHVEKAIHWGTDDPACKGGDYFQAKQSPRPWTRKGDAEKLRSIEPQPGTTEAYHGR